MNLLRKCLLASLLFAFAALALADGQPADPDSVLHRDLALPYLIHLPQRGAAGAPLIVLLHGMGSNEQDLYSLRDDFPSRYGVVSARAPYTLGEGSYQWFAGTDVGGRLDGKPDELDASRARIERLIDQLVKRYGFDPQAVYLVGFSQGAIMSYEVALTDPGEVRGIGVMSGAIFDSLVPQIKPSFALSHLSVFISHGEDDPVIPHAYAIEADQRLQQLGIHPSFHLYPDMRHEINESALQDLVDWLAAQ
ncbi:alpha/beta hydrolase [Burkholderia sp. WAC0059]|uniref:alpha/beta hydrolase n=1 Tax=Burkholderia sp. WAC0059 TaxID=2066022 RepID=UPI0015E080C6|nr:PHB depolymerase family esterase [Burkholderia sp. WAC0059]